MLRYDYNVNLFYHLKSSKCPKLNFFYLLRLCVLNFPRWRVFPLSNWTWPVLELCSRMVWAFPFLMVCLLMSTSHSLVVRYVWDISCSKHQYNYCPYFFHYFEVFLVQSVGYCLHNITHKFFTIISKKIFIPFIFNVLIPQFISNFFNNLGPRFPCSCR